MEERLFLVPTYYGTQNKHLPEPKYERLEFSDPIVPILVHEADGLRLILGARNRRDLGAPDIQVERRPNGWVIFLHPVGGGDASGFVLILDDGRSFVVPESPTASTRPIEFRHEFDEVKELDDISDS